MSIRRLIQIAQLIQVCEKIEGRVKLQKMVHILKEAGHSFSHEFGYLHHGPYSSELKRDIDHLTDDLDLVQEDSEDLGSAGDKTRYNYSPKPTLLNTLKEISVDSEPEWQQLARELNEKSSQDLEATSTIIFLQRRDFDGEKLKRRFAQLKPHLANIFEVSLEEANRILADSE